MKSTTKQRENLEEARARQTQFSNKYLDLLQDEEIVLQDISTLFEGSKDLERLVGLFSQKRRLQDSMLDLFEREKRHYRRQLDKFEERETKDEY